MTSDAKVGLLLGLVFIVAIVNTERLKTEIKIYLGILFDNK